MNEQSLNKEQKAFGERLKLERVRLNLSKQQTAEKLNVSSFTYSKYENGTTSPSLRKMYSLKSIGFDIVYVIHGNVSLQTVTPQIITLDAVNELLTTLEKKHSLTLTKPEKIKYLSELI